MKKRRELPALMIGIIVAFVPWGGATAEALPHSALAVSTGDIREVDAELRGTVLVLGGEIFDADLEPIGTVAEYQEAYEDAGFAISDLQIQATIPPGTIAVAPGAPMGVGFGTGIGGPVKTEAPGCKGHDRNRSLQTLTRAGKSGVVTRGLAHRKCGVAGSKGWGWRHVASEHKDQWDTIAKAFGKKWDAFAVWAISGIVGSPSNVTYQSSRDTFLYTAPVQLWRNGKLVTTYNPKVSVANKSWNIITAYPAR